MRWQTELTGSIYNKTVAYRPDQLSTSICFHVDAAFEAINYTQLQYPPPNSLLTHCVMPGHGPDWTPASETDYVIAASPMFSYPQDVTLLVPTWKLCTLTNIIGALDPPHTLGPATAMDPVSSSSPAAAPAAHITPTDAPATPTPSAKEPIGGTLNSPKSIVNLVDPTPAADPKASSGSGNQQNSQQSNSQNIEAPKAETVLSLSVHPFTNDPPSNNDPRIMKDPSNNEPSKTSKFKDDPSNKTPSKNDPSRQGSTNNNSNPPSNHPPMNDPVLEDPPINNDPPSNTSPTSDRSTGKDGSRDGGLPANDVHRTGRASIIATVSPVSPPTNALPQESPDQNSTPIAANPVQQQGLGAQIASAFGYIPGSTASPVNNPDVPNSEPKAIETVVNGSPSSVMAGGSPFQKVSNNAVLVAGSTIARGSQAIVSGAVVSVGSDNVVIDGTNHAFPPMAAKTPTPLLVGANTAQRMPNGGLVVASQTLALGDQTTVAGVAVSIDSSKAIVDGTTHNLAPIASTPPLLIVNGATTVIQPGIAGAYEAPVVNIGGQAMTLSQASPGTNIVGQTLTPGLPHLESPFLIAGQTLIPGGAAITVSGVPISLPASQIPSTNLPAMAIEASPLSAGGPAITIAGTVISLQPSGARLVVGGSAFVFGASAPPDESPTPITIGDQIFTPNPSAFAIAGTTISAGGPGVSVAGTFVSLQPSGAGLVVGSNTLAVAAPAPSTSVPTPITIGNQIFTPNPSAFSIAGTTISAGGPGVTVAGTFVSLQPSGAGLVMGSSTLALPTQATPPNAVTIGSEVFTPNPTGFSIAGTTLSAGGSGITIQGTLVSLEASGSGVVVGSSTIAFQGTSLGVNSQSTTSNTASTTSNPATESTNASPSLSMSSTPSGGRTSTTSTQASSSALTCSPHGIPAAFFFAFASILAFGVLGCI